MNGTPSDQRTQICNLALKNQRLIATCLNRGWIYDAKALMQLDASIAALYALSPKGYAPNQPRVPAGHPDGGQWTDDSRWEGGREDTEGAGRDNDQRPANAESIQYLPNGAIAGNDRVEYVKRTRHPLRGQVKKVNIFVGGAKDSTQKIVRNSYSLNFNSYGDNYYTNWGEEEEIAVAKFITQVPDDWEINLIGHSYGADSAARTAIKAPNRISKLITIDPVSKIITRPKYSEIYKSVGTWVNVNAVGSVNPIPTVGDIWAGMGGAWNDGPEEHADVYIEAPFDHDFFQSLMDYAQPNKKSPQQILNK